MDSLPIALQCYIPPVPKAKGTKRKEPKGFQPPDYLLILDTETATENTRSMPGFGEPQWSGMKQSLLFGRMIVAARVAEPVAREDHVAFYRLGDTLYRAETEYVFYPDHLPESGLRLIRESLGAKPLGDHLQPDHEPFTNLYLLPLSEFMKIFYTLACRLNSYVIGFNLPYDLSRLAIKVNPARAKFFYDGFTFTLWDSPYRPRLRIAHIGSKRDFSGWSASLGKFQNGKPTFIPYKSRFIDLHTLAFGLTSDHHSLASAAKLYRIGIQKRHAEVHGVITPDYLAYNRQDVLVTLDLAFAMLNEYLRHPILTLPEKIFSPASIAKGYLQTMNIRPRMELQPRFSPRIQVWAMSAYYGGRVDTMIRKSRVAVVHTDFLSMYPTVNSLMHIWDLIIARAVKVVLATKKTQALLEAVTAEGCFHQEIWPQLRGMALIRPQGDLLPVRAQYGKGLQIGQNPFHSSKPQWVMLPDLVASKIRTGRTPEILRAVVFDPLGLQEGLRPCLLQNQVEIDPTKDDSFRKVIEERLTSRPVERSTTTCLERSAIPSSFFSKILANAGGYGIYAERNEVHSAKPRRFRVYSDSAFWIERDHWEVPGKHFFAPQAALTAAAARLMLALLEREVVGRGGCYVTTDTDSMMIVADETRHDITIQGRGADGKPIPQTITALTWQEVREIASKFERLNPYDPAKLPGSILKIEDDNFDKEVKQRKLYCNAIGPKRYCLFINGDKARLSLEDIVDPKESGLKFFLDPQAEEDDEDFRRFVKEVWLRILNNEPFSALPGAARPLVYRFAVTTAYLWKRFKRLNAGRPYPEQIKPFDFLLQASTEYDFSSKSSQTLIAPFDPDPTHWQDLDWIDYRENGDGASGSSSSKRTLRTVESYLNAYKDHPEYAYNGPDGKPCSAKTAGVLSRRPVSALNFVYQGKGMMDEDDIQSNVQDSEEGSLFYGKTDYKKLMLLVLKIMQDIPRDFLAEFIPVKSYKTFQAWQTRKRTPKDATGLIEAVVAWARQIVPDLEGLGAKDLLKAYLACKKELSGKVRRMARQIPDAVLHHKMNLNARTIAKLRKGEDLRMETLKRLDKLLTHLYLRAPGAGTGEHSAD